MKAVNLIPEDQRRGGGSAAGKSGGAAYGLLGALAVLVLIVSAWAVTGKQITDRKAEVSKLQAEASAAQQRAATLTPYRDFAKLSQERITTVQGLLKGRFDWAHALREVGRVVPADAWMTSLTGTVAPGVGVGGGTAGGGSGGRDAVAAPAIEVVGCVPDLARVATLMARLRTIDGVDKVSLGTTEKNETATDASAGGAAGASTGDCRRGSDQIPQFNLVVFFKPVPGLVSPAGATAPAGTQADATKAASATPASSSTGSSNTASPNAAGGTSK